MDSVLHEQMPACTAIAEDLPPPALELQSKYVYDAEKQLTKYGERWSNIPSFASYCKVCLSCGSFLYSSVTSADRLVAISKFAILVFLLDDLFIDSPEASLRDQYGFDSSSLENPGEHLERLDSLFGQQSDPGAAPIEIFVWETGRDMLRLSNLEWFTVLVESLLEHHRASIRSVGTLDLESFTSMRGLNFGGNLIQLVVEFAHDSYLQRELRAHPILLQVRDAATMHMAFVNDIYSYCRESMKEANPRNVITVLMESKGMSLMEAVRAATGLVNSYGVTIFELTKKISPSGSPARCHLRKIEDLLVGNERFHSSDKRYQHPASLFPELNE